MNTQIRKKEKMEERDRETKKMKPKNQKIKKISKEDGRRRKQIARYRTRKINRSTFEQINE